MLTYGINKKKHVQAELFQSRTK